VKYEAEIAHTWTVRSFTGHSSHHSSHRALPFQFQVYAYDGTVLAMLTTRIHHLFHDDSLPLLKISPSVTDDRELQFILLILLYSETKRRDRSLKKVSIRLQIDSVSHGTLPLPAHGGQFRQT
jgi:hypothetical protein